MSRDDLLTEVRGYRPSSDVRPVDFHLLDLRREIEHDPAAPLLLPQHHGVGRQLVD